MDELYVVNKTTVTGAFMQPKDAAETVSQGTATDPIVGTDVDDFATGPRESFVPSSASPTAVCVCRCCNRAAGFR
jgi:hypothetical protein